MVCDFQASGDWINVVWENGVWFYNIQMNAGGRLNLNVIATSVLNEWALLCSPLLLLETSLNSSLLQQTLELLSFAPGSNSVQPKKMEPCYLRFLLQSYQT